MNPALDASTPTLRSVLFTNAAFSGLSGSALMVAAAPLAELFTPDVPAWFGLPAWAVLAAIGAGVVLFGLDVALVARRRPPARWLVWTIFGADVGWLLGSALVLAAAAPVLSGAGAALIAIVALVVGAFAWLELRGLRTEV